MKLRKLEEADIVRVAEWLAEPSNNCWLDFGAGQGTLSAVTLRVMSQRPQQHELRVYTSDQSDEAIGLVALNYLDGPRRTANLWYVLGDKRYAGQGYTSRAVGGALELAFTALGLRAVQAWVADGNTASLRLLERHGFRYVGRLRQAHEIDGKPTDRVLFDLLESEFGNRIR